MSNSPKIICYLKPICGWSNGVRAVLNKYNLPFEDRDIWNDPSQREEMIRKSGQELSPCVEVNGHMLADISGEELESWMLTNKVIKPSDKKVDVPLDAGCPDHAPTPTSVTINFNKK